MKKNHREIVHSAVMRRDLAALIKALDQGFSPDEKDRDGRTPLFYASRDGEYPLANELIKRGANVDMKDENQQTPLHVSAQEYHIDIAKLLINRGATIDIQDIYGNTPLWRATFSSRGRGEMILFLLSAGANQNLKNIAGVSPQDLAKSIANYEINKFFSPSIL